MTGTLTATIYDSACSRTGFVGEPIFLTYTARMNTIGTGTLVIPDDHTYVDALSAPGARIVIDYIAAEGLEAKRFSGRLAQVAGSFASPANRTYTITSDFALCSRLLGWPNPTQPISSQGLDASSTGSSTTPGAYYTATGAAEQVFKDALQANLTRLGLTSVTVAPIPESGARGAIISVSLRMDVLSDKLFPLMTQAGLMVTAQQSGSTIVVDVATANTYPLPLARSTGVILDGSWARLDPTVTRAIVGGVGDGANRDFVSVVDNDLEAEWGLVAEVFVDGSDAGSDYSQALANKSSSAEQVATAKATYMAALNQKGLDAIAAGAPSYQLSLTLSETDVFAYGITYDVGDLVTVKLDDANSASDSVTAVTLTYDADNGLVVQPTVGDGTDVYGMLAKAIASVAKAQRITTSAR